MNAATSTPIPLIAATSSSSSPATHVVVRCLGLALLITLLHLGVLLQGPLGGGGLLERYHRLVQLDSYWFWNIVDRGYQSPVPPSPVKRMEVSNTAFFPGYPLLGAAVVHGLNLHPKTGLTLASQLATVGFWTYFLLIARRLGLSRRRTAVAVLLVLAHPAAFYLIAAFSESLFLFFTLGYFLWGAREGRLAFWLAAAHGVGMTGTRIAGAPAAFLPVVRAWAAGAGERFDATWLRAAWSGAVRRGAILAGLSLLGMIAFFGYCHVRWGHWDFYMMTQQAGWGVKPDYLALLKPGAYMRWYPQWDYAWPLGQFFVPATVVFYAGLAAWEISAARRGPTRWRERIGLHFTGFVLFALAVSGVYSVRLESMTRYHLCAHVFLVLGTLHAYADIGPRRASVRQAVTALAATAALFGALIQLRYAAQFARGEWVA